MTDFEIIQSAKNAILNYFKNFDENVKIAFEDEVKEVKLSEALSKNIDRIKLLKYFYDEFTDYTECIFSIGYTFNDKVKVFKHKDTDYWNLEFYIFKSTTTNNI